MEPRVTGLTVVGVFVVRCDCLAGQAGSGGRGGLVGGGGSSVLDARIGVGVEGGDGTSSYLSAYNAATSPPGANTWLLVLAAPLPRHKRRDQPA
jgi:hypothetical protein